MKKIVFFVVMALACQLARAQQSGDLDPTFGTSGIAQTAFADESFEVDMIRNVVVQPDGKIIAAGSTRIKGVRMLAFCRYLPDGSIDSSFGEEGQLIMQGEPYACWGVDAATLSDNSVLLCAYIIYSSEDDKTSPMLIKITPEGQIDKSFGNQGNGVMIDNQTQLLPEKIRVLPDDRIIVAGYFEDNMMALCYNSDGSRDNTFGQNGLSVVTVEEYPNASFAKNLDIQPDGKILLGGFCATDSHCKWLVARLNVDGSLDQSFASNGYRIIPIGGGHDFATAVRVQLDGKILLAGHSWDTNIPHLHYSAAVMRLNSDGTTDESFAESGLFRKRFIEGGNYVSGLVLSTDGKMYLDLSLDDYSEYNIGVFSLDQNGALNTAFGNNGCVITDINGAEDHSEAIAIQPDGKILVGAKSYAADGSGTPFTIVRYLTEAPTDLISPITDQSIIVYPNPVENILNIKYDGICKVQIFDMTGRMLIDVRNTHSVDVSTLSAGSYIVRVTAGDAVWAEQFVKI